MCGIFALFGDEVEVSSYLLSHRGPDDYRSKISGKCRMDFYRLAINDLTPAGMQPFRRGEEMLICNGEIYNHHDFRRGDEVSNSDCEVLLPMIKDYGIMKTLEISTVISHLYGPMVTESWQHVTQLACDQCFIRGTPRTR